jgi:hypothetical protein
MNGVRVGRKPGKKGSKKDIELRRKRRDPASRKAGIR